MRLRLNLGVGLHGVHSASLDVRRSRVCQELWTILVKKRNRWQKECLTLSEVPAVLAGSSRSIGLECRHETRFTLPANASQATFDGIAFPVAGTTVRTVSATSGGTTVSAQITVAPGQPFSLVIVPDQGQGRRGGTSGVVVSLSVDGPEISLPSSILVSAGTTYKDFTMTTQLTAVTRIRTVSAAIGVVTRSATLTIEPGDPFALAISPATVQGGTTASGRVLLAGASVMDTTFTMTSDGVNVNVPATVTVPAGALQKTFSMTTAAVDVTTVRTITATHAGVSRSQTLTLTP